MSTEDYSRLRKALPMLQQYLRPDRVMEKLFAKGVVDMFEREDIRAVPARWRRCLKLCDVIMTSSQQGYDLFIQILRETGQAYLADAIQEERDPNRGL